MTDPNILGRWIDTAKEWAEDTIENGPTYIMGKQTAEAVAQTIMALLACRNKPHSATRFPDVSLPSDLFDELHDYFAAREDVRDGTDCPRPNQEMSLLMRLKEAEYRSAK